MSALTTYSANNRVIDSGKAVTYSKTLVTGQWTYSSGVGITETIYSAWQYLRHCTKSYRYVGLSQSAATSCVNAMITKYTRSVQISRVKTTDVTSGDVFETIDGGTQIMASVRSRFGGDGSLWTVCIDVDEVDSRMSTDGTLSPSSFFSSENNRDYDET